MLALAAVVFALGLAAGQQPPAVTKQPQHTEEQWQTLRSEAMRLWAEAQRADKEEIHLQPRLLLFLLLYHTRRLSVYDIIEKFISKVRDQLQQLDFKKTKTGVTRCYTNTRVAAHTLRDYGLLKFTRREAEYIRVVLEVW